MLRVTLDRDDFVHLIRGGTVVLPAEPPVEICLADIGYPFMRSELKQAMTDNEPRLGQLRQHRPVRA